MSSLENQFDRFGHRVYRHYISVEDSQPDLRHYVQQNATDLPVEGHDRDSLIEQLVEKSSGIFLWMYLAVEELKNVYSKDDIREALDRVPAGMTLLCHRQLTDMA